MLKGSALKQASTAVDLFNCGLGDLFSPPSSPDLGHEAATGTPVPSQPESQPQIQLRLSLDRSQCQRISVELAQGMLPRKAFLHFSCSLQGKLGVSEQPSSLPSGHTAVEASREEMAMNYLSKPGALWKALD